MSKFNTTLKIDIAGVIKLLPPRSYVHSIKMGAEKDSLVITWDSDLFKSKYEESEFTIEQLREGSVPVNVTIDPTKEVKRVKVAETTEPQPESVGVGNKEIATVAGKRKK